MRDNIKPVEAKFFKYCMKRLSHHDVAFDGTVGTIMTMRQMIVDFSNRYGIPRKVIESIVNKWDGWFLDECYRFDPYKFPAEYIMLIPRRVLRKCVAFGCIVMDKKFKDDNDTKWREYDAIFRYKTIINGLDDCEAILENTGSYWLDFSIERYDRALFYINKEICRTNEPPRLGTILRCTEYIILCNIMYSMIKSCGGDDGLAHRINDTARTIKRVTAYLKRLNADKYDSTILEKLDNIYHDILSEQ